jgi:hypothetical protein
MDYLIKSGAVYAPCFVFKSCSGEPAGGSEGRALPNGSKRDIFEKERNI